MKSTVLFADLRVKGKQNILQKLELMLNRLGIADKIQKNHIVAVKLHFGERGNTAYVRPVYVQRVIQRLAALGARAFLTDTNTLYVGSRGDSVNHYATAVANGFDYAAVGAPVVIAGGLRGTRAHVVEVNLPRYREVEIAPEIADADAVIGVTHFKGHEMSGFGGTLKNFGMGAASRQAKLSMHSSTTPFVSTADCTGCQSCRHWCAFGAIVTEEKKSRILKDRCRGCGACLPTCPVGAIRIEWNQSIDEMQEKMVEHAYGALHPKRGRSLFLNFLLQISPLCDCYPFADAPIVADIGVLGSEDPVAIDQASADLVNQQPGNANSVLKSALAPGEDKFRVIAPQVDWTIQLVHAERIGLGRRDYELVRV